MSELRHGSESSGLLEGLEQRRQKPEEAAVRFQPADEGEAESPRA